MSALPMEKQTQAILFDPQKEREVKRQKQLAELLVAQGNQPFKNEVAGGMTVARSPWEFANQGAQKAYGEYKLGKADDQEAELEKRRQQMIQEALSQWGQDPQAAAQMLAQDPRTSDMAMKLMGSEVDYGRQKERWNQQDALQRELAQMRISAMGSGGGNTPAAMQIANQMFELEQMMNNPSMPEDQRFLAERQYNLLGQAAKTYGFDRGLQAGAMGGYESVFGGQQSTGGIPPVNMMPNGEMQAPSMGNQTPDGPLNPMQYQDMMQQNQFNGLINNLTGRQTNTLTPNSPGVSWNAQENDYNFPRNSTLDLSGVNTLPNGQTLHRAESQDPMAAHAQAVAQQQQQIGVSPMQRPELRGVGMQEVPGYGQAAAGIAAQKKLAEGRAGEIGKRQGENENLYRSMVSRMPQLEDTAERLSKLGQAATYTNAGQIRDFTLRELGREVPDSATARAEYISMVDNEILPLLRDTFGAQFTQKEGESLKATLGSPNVSPKEKDAVLRSFMRTKAQALESLERELNSGQSLPNYTPRDLNIGGQSYSPMGAKPQMGRENIVQTLRQNGASDEEINAYLQARGL